MAIKTFRDRHTEAVFERRTAKRFGPDIAKAARRKLVYLDAARYLEPRLAAEQSFAGRERLRRRADRLSLTRKQGHHAMPDLAPIHPGEILREEFLVPLNLSVYALAKAIGVPQTRIAEIVHERRAVTADTALRLGRFFKTSAELWMNLQARFDLETARDARGAEIEATVQPSDLIAA